MILTRLPGTFSEASPQKLRNGLIVPGYTHRWMSDEITAAVDTVVTSWTDYTAGLALGGANGPTVKAIGDGRKYLQFDGVNDTLKSDAVPTGDAITVILVAKYRGAAPSNINHQLVTGAASSVGRYNTQLYFNNNVQVQTTAISANDQWRFFAAVAPVSGTASLTIDATKITTPANGVFGTSLRLGANGAPANFAPVDVIELVTYPTALSDSDIASVRTALKASYPTLLV